MKKGLFCFLIMLVSPLFIAAEDTFTVAGIQFEISPEKYHSAQNFFDEAERIIGQLCSEENPDLIIFPEYIGVFFQLIEHNSIIEDHDNFQDALRTVLAANPELQGPADIFTMSSNVTSYLEGWSLLARRWKVAIIAGSCFVAAENGELKNRSYVFDEDGKLIYQQDKVFLTEFETDIIGLAPGDIDRASFFKVGGHDIAMTICRDTYFSEWEDKNSGAFIWVDIKANGERYDTEQKRSFMRALPLRMIETDVDFGITVCTVGSYLDLFWEGESSALYKNGGGLFLADISDDFSTMDSIILRIYREQ